MTKFYLIIFTFISLFSFGQMTSYNYDFDGNNREFNVHIPDTYNASTDTLPLVFFLHGMGGDMNNFSALSYKSDQEKYIMIVPQALSDPFFGTSWHSGAGGTLAGTTYYPNSGIDDVAFINSLMDTISTWYNIDVDRIYVTGFSMGGYMTNRLGCELGDRVAAIASVAGTIGGEISGTCNPDNIIPSLHIHSTTDGTVSYDDNNFGLNAEVLVDFWIENNNCDTIPLITDLSDVSTDGGANFSTTKYLYTGGDLNSEVEYYKLVGPEHSQSWFTATGNNDFDAIEVIWDFFDRHENKKEEIEQPEPNLITNLDNVSMDVFPNPATEKITLNFSTKTKVSKITIGNILGKIISSKIYEEPIESTTFNISDQTKGVYFFRIEDFDGNKSVIRFYKK